MKSGFESSGWAGFEKAIGVNLVRTGVTCLIGFLIFIGGCVTEETTTVVAPPDYSLDPAVAPAVTATYPPDGAVEPPRIYRQSYGSNGLPHFRIDFNKMMLQSSLNMSSIRVSGFDTSLHAHVVLTGIRQGRSFDFAVCDRDGNPVFYPAEEVCRVTVDTTVVDVFGNHTNASYTFSFIAEQHFRLLGSSPYDGQVGYPISRVGFYFNSIVDTMQGHAVSMDPVVTGSWGVNGRTLIFTPSIPFRGNQTYRFGLDRDIRDNRGHALQGPSNVSFSLPAFALLYYPSDTLYRLDQSLRFTFNYPLDRSSIEGNCSIEAGGEYVITSSSTEVWFNPGGNLKPFSTVKVIVGKGLKSAVGDSLGNFAEIRMTVPQFKISTDKWKFPIQRDESIEFACNAILDSVTVVPSFSIVPRARGHIQIEPAWSGGFSFVPDSVYVPGTTYTITINKSLRAQGGYNLPEDYSVSFTTR